MQTTEHLMSRHLDAAVA